MYWDDYFNLVDDIYYDPAAEDFIKDGRHFGFDKFEELVPEDDVIFSYEFLEHINLLPKLEQEIEWPLLKLNRMPTPNEEKEILRFTSWKYDPHTYVLREGYFVFDRETAPDDTYVGLYETSEDNVYFCPYDGCTYFFSGNQYYIKEC